MIDNNKKLSVNLIKKFSAGELQELCKATEEAITAGIGFSWIKPPSKKKLRKLLERSTCNAAKKPFHWKL